MKKFAKTLASVLLMAMLLSLTALAAPAVTEMEGTDIVVADSGEKLTSATYENEVIVKGSQYMIFVVDGDLPTADSILYINQAEAEDDGVVTFENVYPKAMMNSKVMISGSGFAAPVTIAEIVVEETEIVKGDVDHNGAFDVGDVVKLMRYLAELIEESQLDLSLEVADFDGSGAVDVGDATSMLQALASAAATAE